MRALIRTGPSKVLTLANNHPDVTTDDFPDSYIIRVKATALTRDELNWPEPLESTIPIPGYDFAGVVVAIPKLSGSKDFKIGDEVYGLTSFRRQGNARDLAAVVEEELALKPKNMGWEEAAATPLSALSAYQGLFVHGGLSALGLEGNEGKRVLVTAASGGVGIWAVQLAHQAGAHVVGTCGPLNIALVKDLGADMVLDYKRTDLQNWVNKDRESRSFDVVIDCIDGQTLTDAWKCVGKNAKVISVAEPADLKKPSDGVADQVQGKWFIVEANRDQLEQVTELIDEGICRSVVDQEYELENWEEAVQRLEGGHAKGKVVLRI